MDNNFDNKKIIQMVAIIGILCVFVGVATRIRQTHVQTLSSLNNNTKEEAASSIVAEQTAAVDNSNDNFNDKSTADSSNSGNSTVGNSTVGNSTADNSTADNSTADSSMNMSQEEYNNFFYIVDSDGLAQITLLYYNYDHEITKGKLVSNEENAYELLLIFYKLYKNQYEFESIVPLSEFESEEASKSRNNTYCCGSTLYINPLYNPCVTYNSGISVCFPTESEVYADRNNDFPYKITTEDYAYILLTEAGYYWSGNKNGSKDYSEFSK